MGRRVGPERLQHGVEVAGVELVVPLACPGESERFGHKLSAFTGAALDRTGWLEGGPRLGTVFLDEVAEIDAAIQAKLLRVLPARTFQRVGDTRAPLRGHDRGRHQPPPRHEMQAGRFRPDLYYRLCAVVIETPTLAAQLRDDPGALGPRLRFIAQRVAGGAEADAVAEEAEAAITTQLGTGYTPAHRLTSRSGPWPLPSRRGSNPRRYTGRWRPSRAPPRGA